MVKKIGQIKRELAAIEETVVAVADELHDLYRQYLNGLSQSARKQLILVGYQICTQVYPKSFLKLSLRHKEQLQAELRELGQQIQPRLLACLESEPADQDLNIMEQMLSDSVPDYEAAQGRESEDWEANPLRQTESRPTASSETPASVPLEELLEEELEELQQPLTESELLAQALTEIAVEDESFSEEELEAASAIAENNPENLVRRQKQIEQKIRQTLETLSQEANYLLHKAQVLPNKLPAKIFEAAVRSEESSAPTSGSPNLLNLLVEAENKRSQKSAVAKITAICLRLSEIEFSDPPLSAQRRQIRKLVDKINKIRRQYRQKQSEYVVAEAEAAWRAIWFEE